MSLKPKTRKIRTGKAIHKKKNSPAKRKIRTIHIRDKLGLHQFDYQEVDHVDSIMKYDYNKIKHLNSWGYRFGQPTLVVMSPSDFLKFAPLQSALTSESSLKSIRKGIKDGDEFETPFMDITEKGVVVSHEGRHRATVLMELGETKMPVIINDRRLKEHDWRDHEPPDVINAVKQFKKDEKRREFEMYSEKTRELGKKYGIKSMGSSFVRDGKTTYKLGMYASDDTSPKWAYRQLAKMIEQDVADGLDVGD